MTSEAAYVAAILAIIMFFIGVAIGSVSTFHVYYEKDAYDCTVKCPDNSHSIRFNKTCYCETE
jgi:hypothetical protein